MHIRAERFCDVAQVGGRHGVIRWTGQLVRLYAKFCALAAIATCLNPRVATAVDKSGVSPQAISLPKGPGSIEGLGESFQPTLNTGTAKYGIRIIVPSGVAGHTPELALRYEGGDGNGPFGFGWQLPVANVQRLVDKGIPLYDGELPPTGTEDWSARYGTFINENKEELVPKSNGDFFCKNEGAFTRYRQVSGHWEATQPDGTRQEFGLTDMGRVQDGSNRIFSWLLERQTDTHGNVIVFSYTNFSGERDLRRRYLSAIRYGPGAPPWPDYYFVAFRYEDRSDWFEDCRAGFVVRTGHRLKSIVIGTHGPILPDHIFADIDGDGIPDSLVRRYEMDYVKYAGTNSHWSLLSRIQVIGANGVSSLPPHSFAYNLCDPLSEISAAGKAIGAGQSLPFLMDSDLVDLVDLNSDGLPDILKTDLFGGTHTALLNKGEKRSNQNRVLQWSIPTSVGSVDGQAFLINLQSSSPVAHLADIDGDGLSDLVVSPPSFGFERPYYFANQGNVRWGPRREITVQNDLPPSPFGDPDVRLADLDFDKRIDIIQSLPAGAGIIYRIWFSLGNQSYSSPVTVPQTSGLAFSQSGVQIADFNGDRVPDIVWVNYRQVIVSAGLGYGRFADPVTNTIPDVYLDDYQNQRARLIDLNGDGLADLVVERATEGTLWCWINLGNYSFSGRKTISGLPVAVGKNPSVRWADLNGNGTIDLVYADSFSAPQLQIIDVGELLGCGSIPNLLTAISNGMGRVTLIGYAPSTRYALEDATTGHSWPYPMPFPVSVVASMTNLDSLGHQYVSQFRYHDGYYDPVEKQFRGFSRVEQVDLGDVSAATLVTRSYFDIGREFEVMKGRLLRLTTEQEDGMVFNDSTTSWTIPPVTLYVGTNGVVVHYTHPIGATNVIKELGQGTERRLESEMAYDNFGNQTMDADYGIVESGDRSSFNDERITVTEYAINTNAWILRTPARQEIRDGNGAVISRADLFYDDETFSGNNPGIVSIGNLTLKRDWISPSNSTATISSTRTKYDSYGNPVSLLDPLAAATGGSVNFAKGHAREIAYDSHFHTYPITERIHLGNGKPPLIFQASYDEGFGTVARSTDFNGNTTTYSYDTFARLTSIVKPGDTPAYPTVEYDYALAVSFSSTSVVNYVETRQLDKVPGTAGAKRNHYLLSRQFVDGLGRKMLTKQEAEPAPGGTASRVVVSEALQFNARQKPTRVLSPFFSTLGGPLDDLLAFENIEAPGWRGQFHNEGSLVTLGLAAAHSTRTEYDATLRPTHVTNPDGTLRRTVYEPLLTRSFDENDNDSASPYHDTPMVHSNDGLGRLVRVEEISRLNDDGTPAGTLKTWTTLYQYDLHDQLTQIRDSQHNIKTFGYDGLKRKIGMNDPDRGVMHFVYDDASNLTETTDSKGQRITYTYDGANRIRTEKHHDGLPPPSWRSSQSDEALTNSVVYHYDQPFPNLPQGDNTLATAQNVKGALVWVEDLSGEEHTSYDQRGRVESVVKRIPDPQLLSLSALGGEGRGEVALISYRTAFAYDSLDRLTNLTYPDADQLRYEYNDRNLLQRIPGGFNGSQGQPGNILSNLLYLPSGQVAQIDYGNGVRSTYTYDSRLRLKNLLTVSQPATINRQLINFAYDFDGVSNIKSIADLRPGATVSQGDPRRNTQLFQYDDLYRLTRVQYSFALPGAASRNDGEINYRYDRIGNMLAQTSTLNHQEKGLPVANLGQMDSGGSAGRSGRIGRQANEPPGPHALTSIIPASTNSPRVYAYDSNGNMTNIDGLLCTWDFKDRLVAVENAEMRAAYTYDYTDRRIIKRVAWKPGYPLPSDGRGTRGEDTTTVSYINKYFEVREHDAPTKYVWHGHTRVARVTGSLNTNVRVQRLRVSPGWNLCSLAVNCPLSAFGGEGQGEVVSSAFKWDLASQDWQPVTLGASLPAGTVLWLQATTNATLTITGTYADPTNRTVTASGGFLPSAGLEAWNMLSAISNQPSTTLWTYDAPSTRWHSWLPPPLELRSDLPTFIAPGQAVLARGDASSQLEVADSALRIRYYHQDHLGSPVCVSTALGQLLRETQYLPFGAPRIEADFYGTAEPNGFSQKERDSETLLVNFGTRASATTLGRFIRSDPLALAQKTDWLLEPQKLNLYAFCANNPIIREDLTGNDSEKIKFEFKFSGQIEGVGFQAKLRMVSEMTSAGHQSDYIELKLKEGVPAQLFKFGTKDGHKFFESGVGLGPALGSVMLDLHTMQNEYKFKVEAETGANAKFRGGARGFSLSVLESKVSANLSSQTETTFSASGRFLMLEKQFDVPLSKVMKGMEKAYSAFDSLGHSPDVRPEQTGSYGVNASQTTFSGANYYESLKANQSESQQWLLK